MPEKTTFGALKEGSIFTFGNGKDLYCKRFSTSAHKIVPIPGTDECRMSPDSRISPMSEAPVEALSEQEAEEKMKLLIPEPS